MTVSEKIRLLLGRHKMTVTKLASTLGISRQYLTKKLRENDFTIGELINIAEILDCHFLTTFITNDTDEEI